MTIAEHGTHTTWSPVQGGLHVANRDGAFMGFAEKGPGDRFTAFNAYSEPIGEFADLSTAMAAVERGTSARRRRRLSSLRRAVRR